MTSRDGRRSSTAVGAPELDDGLLTRLEDVATMACHGIPGCEAAAVRVVLGHDVATVGATSDAARALDAAQSTAGDGPCLWAVRHGRTVCVEDYRTDPRWPAVAREAAAAGLRSTLCLPLLRRGAVLGVLELHGRRPHAFDSTAQQVGEVLARQAAGAISDAELRRRRGPTWTAEGHVAQTLQRDLLPVVPELAGIAMATRYAPAHDGAGVCGDWYDAFPLPRGRIGLVIGDAMGHGVGAAAAMSQLRTGVRSYAYTTDSPADVLDRLDRLVQGFDLTLATAVHGNLLLRDDGAVLQFCNAGHPPPLVRRPDGGTHRLDDGGSWLIGAPSSRLGRRADAVAWLPSGSSLVLYTDGLVERHRHDLDRGIDLLCEALSGAPPGTGPEGLCDELLEVVAADGPGDDRALLVVQVQ